MKQMRIVFYKMAAAFLCVVMLFTACGASKPQTNSISSQSEEMPENMTSVYGEVLDYTDDTLILRTNGGLEYVLKLGTDTILPSEGLAAGAKVEVMYQGSLSGKGENRPDIYCIRTAQAQAADPVYTGSTIDGVVTRAALNDTSIRTSSGKEYTFATADTVNALRDGAAVGMWVRIVFDGELNGSDTSGVVVRNVLECAVQPVAVQTLATVKSYDEQKHSMTVQTNCGGRYTFDTQYVEFDTPNGFYEGGKILVYSRGQLVEEDVQNPQCVVYRVSDVRLAPTSQFDAVLEKQSETGTLVLHLADGRVLEMYANSSTDDEQPQAGDVIRVHYTGELCGTDLSRMKVKRIEVRTDAQEADMSIQGEIIKIAKSSISLRLEDGCELHFTQLSQGCELSQKLQAGDTARVYYTGWLGSQEDSSDTSDARVTRVVFAYD